MRRAERGTACHRPAGSLCPRCSSSSLSLAALLVVLLATIGTANAGSYYLWDDWGGTWADAEKSTDNTEDDEMCWAASSSNVLEWTGWGKVGGLTDSDDDKDDAGTRPNELAYYDVDYLSGKWFLEDFYGTDRWYVAEVVALKMYVNPLPSAVWMGLGLMGTLAAVRRYRRRRRVI